jgi:SAM-dependent methyltransferase
MEQDRMDLHHEILLLLLEGDLHKAPIVSNPQKILDVGCGTGIWAIDMADKYPSADVLGIDLSPLQPKWCVRPDASLEKVFRLRYCTMAILHLLPSTGAVRFKT